MVRCAADVLEGGHSVLVDATLLRSDQRRAFGALAARLGIGCVLLRCEAPAEVLEQRIRARLAHAEDPSEATLAVLEWQRGRDQPPQAGEGLPLIRVDTTRPEAAAEACAAVVSATQGRAQQA
jgi:predicted kinase